MRSTGWLVLTLVFSLLLLSPPTAWAQDPPIIINLPPEEDETFAAAEYVRQLGLSQGTPPVTWSLMGPAGAVIDNTGKITGWTPAVADIDQTFAIQVQASNTAGTWTEDWTVTVRTPEPFNNGFSVNSIYAIRKYPAPGINPDGMGKIHVYDTIKQQMRDLTNVEGWVSLSFSGTGTNDAYCYTLRGWKGATDNPNWAIPPYDGLNIRAFRADGGVNASCWVHTLPGWVTPAPDVAAGSIRYSSFHNSIFVGVDRNNAAADAALVYELNLGMSQILHVYTGPNTNTGGQVNLDINPRNGTLYVINQRLGNDNGSGSALGDLVAFNTAGGSTSVYTTLVNGQTFAADGQPNHNLWNLPNCVVYRAGVTAADDTLVVFMDTGEVVLEFWANTSAHPVDGNGNLQLKGLLPNLDRGWNGQQDVYDSNIHYGAMADGFGTLQSNNALIEYRNGEADWMDADSPPYPADQAFIPILADVPPNPDQTVANFEYIRQLKVLQGSPVTWSLIDAPAGAHIDQNGLITGWIPPTNYIGFGENFEVQASNTTGSARANWQVLVLDPASLTNNDFPIGHVFVIKNYPNPSVPGGPDMGQIEIFDESDGSVIRGGGPGLGYTNVEGWVSLTFSGTGTNDTWCYTVRRWHTGDPLPHHNPPYDGFNIRKFNAEGGQEDFVNFSVIGPNVLVGNIRYSSFHNHLFVGLDVNELTRNRARAYEINLDLDYPQLRTYTGPFTNNGGAVNVEINPRNGTLYMINQRLGDDNASGGPLGDLVAFANGVSSSYTTLINGQTFAADGQPDHDKWYLPNTVIFRQGDTSADDTLVVFTDGNPATGQEPLPATMEFWADTTAHPVDANGNLQLKRLLPAVNRGWNGQQDSHNRNIHYGALADGYGTLTTKNELIEWVPDNPGWIDADSPPFTYVPGLCNDPFADVDGDGDVDQSDFAILQICISGPNQPIATVPGVCACFDRIGNGFGGPDADVDSFDVEMFELCATGPQIPLDASCDD
jgi:hypothetical protein